MERFQSQFSANFVRLAPIAFLLAIFLASPLHADDLPLTARASGPTLDQCYTDMQALVFEMRSAASNANAIADDLWPMASPLARLPGAMRMNVGGGLTAEHREAELGYIYFQLMPGKAKLLNQKLTQAEVNAVLNELRAKTYAQLRKAGLQAADIEMVFKGVSVALPHDAASPEVIAELEAGANQAFMEIIKEKFPYLLNVYERMGWKKTKFIKAGVASTPYRALLASRIGGKGVIRFVDEQEAILSEFAGLLELTDSVVERLLTHPRLYHLLDRKMTQEASLSTEIFDALRKANGAEDVSEWLRSVRRPPGEGEAQEERDLEVLANELWQVWALMKKFTPPPQFREQDMETYDPESVWKRTRSYREAEYVLVADLVGAGGRVMHEFFEYLLEHQRSRLLLEDRSPDDDQAYLLEVLDGIETPLSIAWIHSQLDNVRETLTRVSGDALLDLWVTGDEIHFLMTESVLHTARESLPNTIRLSENETTYDLEGQRVRLDEFVQSLTIKISETSQKYLKKHNALEGSRLRMASQIAVDSLSQMKLHVHVWGATAGQLEALQEIVNGDLISFLALEFPAEQLDTNLEVVVVSHP